MRWQKNVDLRKCSFFFFFFPSPFPSSLPLCSFLIIVFANNLLWALNFPALKQTDQTSLVAQWFRIRLPMQGTQVQSLVREDPTCRGATRPVRHNYWARVPQLLKPERLEPVLRNKKSHRDEKPALTTTRESPRAAMKTRHSQNNFLNK